MDSSSSSFASSNTSSSTTSAMQPMPLFFFFLFPLLVLLFVVRKGGKLPPGPLRLPILGNMRLMDQLTHRGLAKLSEKYGGLVYLRLGFLDTIAISTPEMAQEILQTQDAIFSNRPATIAVRYLTYDRADMAFAHYGPFWRQMRKLCVMKLFSRKRAESWASVRDEVEDMLREVGDKTGSSVNIGELVFSLTRNITYRAAFGSSSRDGQDEFVSILQEFSKLMGAFNVADFIPIVGWFDPQGFNKRLAKARGALDRFIDTIIDDHMAKKKGGGRSDDEDGDMVDDLLAFFGDGGTTNGQMDDLQGSLKLTRDNIKAIIMDVMFGGTETVASAIEWAMAELMKNPKELKKAQDELEQVVGLDRKVQETDLDKLPFLKCALKETLRLHPPIPLLLHETAEDCKIGGYWIPVGTRVTVNAWAIGRDKRAWEDPELFNPSRFAKEGAPDFKGNYFELIPFGSGRRSCPGMQLGLYALDLAVAQLLHCFKWELPDGMKPSEMDMSDVFGLTAPKAIRLAAVPTPRLNCPLF
ncbi:cytochrome P450 84A1-like protein [Cinnamomum micranthum f. kanehirae]|uniref:Cytochrome P450 84A1-like protein n=1 Tax=Cinnamomum micranthum f. kanehirae TaxID=337451 RepID=A0A3S3Q4F1_9MAGN|nr:cytochrome P450 84A1-like protein [Cinnamomum micranthum f. kanehirae]